MIFRKECRMRGMNKMSEVNVSAIIEKIIIGELGAVPLDKLENISAQLVKIFYQKDQGFIALEVGMEDSNHDLF